MSAPAAGRRPMSLWRLETLRMTRSPRAIAVGGVYLVFGLLGPVLAKYTQDIVNRFGSGLKLVANNPSPKDGIANFVNQAGQTGLIVVVVVAAGALAFDGRRGVSTFFRTRVAHVSQLVLPRFAVNAGAAVGAYALGTLAAWYETSLLLGAPPAGGVLAGLLCGSVYLVFAVALTAAASSIARSTLGTVGLALAVLITLPLLGLVAPLHKWLPSTLVAAPTSLVGTTSLSGFVPAIVVALPAAAALLTVGTARLARREV